MVKLIFKGILFYSLILFIIIVLSGIDSIIDNNLLMETLFILIILSILNYKFLNWEDCEKLSLNKYFNKLLN